MTIRGKLLASYLALTALGMAMLAGFVLLSFRSYFLRTAQADLSQRAEAVGESIADAFERKDLERISVLVVRHATEDQINIRVISPAGRLLATSAPRLDRLIPDWRVKPGVQAALDGDDTSGIEDLPGSDIDEMYAVRPLVRGGELLGVVRISLRLVHFRRQFEGVMNGVLGTLLFTFVLCSFLSAWIARSLALPIQRMRNFAVRMGAGFFGERLEVGGQDELAQLAGELNRMSERLASIDEERRGFLANVSHELRTPVSNVRVTLEALESGADEEEALRRRFIHTCLDETNRLSRLIESLLDLGRLEAGVTSLSWEPFSLRSLVVRCHRAVESRLLAKSLRLRVDVADVRMWGDEERLQQAILNLVDNAIKFTGRGSTLVIEGRAEGPRDSPAMVLCVSDEGPGISAGDLPHVFEQFYTGDRSRKRGGTGLGLAMARRIVEAHGGTIRVVPRDRGTTLEIRIPIRPAAPDAAPEPALEAAEEAVPV